MKKYVVILLFAALVVSGGLASAFSGKAKVTDPFPMWVEIPPGEEIECPEDVQLKYTGCSVKSSPTEGEQAVLQIECTLTQHTPEWTNFFILHQKSRDSRWHIVFATTHPVKAACTFDPPGTATLECVVPRKLFSHPGLYKVGFTDRGTCDLPREMIWDRADQDYQQSCGFPTESGFPMYQDSKLGGPPETDQNAELIETGLVTGDSTDTLRLSVNLQQHTIVDDRSYQVIFCPAKDDKLYTIYRPAESFFHDFPEPTTYYELSPGLNTVEYPVPKDLFKQKGDYYLVCSLGGFRLFGN